MKRKYVMGIMAIFISGLMISGCASVNSQEAMNMIRNNESIEITVAEPEDIEQGKEVVIPWTELAYLENYEELRKEIDDILYIIPMQEGKNGVIYVDEEGNHSNNTTLKDAFNNKKFTEDFWNNTEVSQKIIESSKKEFMDVETDQEALLAAYNAYYNLLADGADPSSANMQSTLTRLEAMSLLFKADTPVDHTLQLSKEYESLLGEGEGEVANPELALFAEQIDKAGNSYLTLSNNSLDQSTATGTMTRAEFIYMIVQRYYSVDYAKLTDTDIKASSKVIAYTDLTNAGNVAKKQNYITTEKNPDTGKKEEKPLARYQAYELNYCLQNPDKGLTEPLYKAYIVANNKGILGTDTDTNWDIGLTKEYALDILCNTLENIGNKVKYDRGESHGESVSTAEDKATESTTASTPEEINAANAIEEAYYTKDDKGNINISEDLYTVLQGYEYFEGASVAEINKYFTDNEFMIESLADGDTEMFKEMLEIQNGAGGHLHKEEQQSSSSSSTTTQSKPSTSTSTSKPSEQQTSQNQNTSQSTNENQNTNQNTNQSQNTTPETQTPDTSTQQQQPAEEVGSMDAILQQLEQGGIDHGNPDIYTGNGYDGYIAY